MKQANKGWSRRSFLRGMGVAAAAAPFVSGALNAAWAQHGQAPKRFIVVYTPNGKIMDQWGADGSEFNFTLRPTLAALAPHKDDLVIFDGIDMRSCMSGPGSGHPIGMAHLLVGRPAQAATDEYSHTSGTDNPMGYAGGISIDQHIAQHIGQDTAFRSLEFGVINTAETVATRICYEGAGRPISPVSDPAVMFNRLFGTAGEGAPSSRRRLIEFLRGDFQRLRSRLGQEDRERLDAHMDHLSDIDQALQNPTTCEGPDLGPIPPLNRASSIPALGKMQMDMLVASLRCDLTRVATLQWICAAKRIVFDQFGHTEDHHILTHRTDATSIAQVAEVDRFFTEQLVYLIERLKATPEGDGTLFDNTMILVCSEVSEGRIHSKQNMPFMLIGNAGGAYQTGRYLAGLGGVAHNDLLVSCMNAMGVPGQSFGSAEFCTGPLTDL